MPVNHLESDSSNLELSVQNHDLGGDITTQSNLEHAAGDSPDPSGENVSHILRSVSKQRQIWVLVSAFLTVAITIGFNQSYGVFQRAYTSGQGNMLPPSQTKNSALVAFVGTLGTGLTWAGSVVINPLMERVATTRYITICGVFLISLGFGLASLSTQVWHLIMTQGLLYGIGSSMLSVTPEYFDTHLGGAMGITLSGAGIGAVILSTTSQAIIEPLDLSYVEHIICLIHESTMNQARASSPQSPESRRH